MELPQLSHLKMHRTTQTSLRNLFLNAFPKTRFISLINNPLQPYRQKSLISSYYTSLQLSPPTTESHAPVKKKNAPRTWDKEKLRWYSEKLCDCVANRSLNEGKKMHKQIMESDIELDSHLWVSLINFYAKCGCLSVGCQVFDEIPQREVVSWTSLISTEVLLFREMHEEGIRGNEFTLATVLKACCVYLNVEFGKQLHSEIVKAGFFSDGHVGCALVDLYAKCDKLEYAQKVGDGEKILRLFCRMKEVEMKFNKYTLCPTANPYPDGKPQPPPSPTSPSPSLSPSQTLPRRTSNPTGAVIKPTRASNPNLRRRQPRSRHLTHPRR